jgi:hypothetical protein
MKRDICPANLFLYFLEQVAEENEVRRRKKWQKVEESSLMSSKICIS